MNQSRLVSGAIGFGRDHQQPAFLPKLTRQVLAQPDGLGAYPEIGAADPTVRSKAFRDLLGGLHRQRAADAAPEVPAIDADNATLGVDERAAGEPGQQLSRRLDQ